MAISIKKLDEKNGTIRYVVKGTSPAFINAVRRSIMLHTPCLAIENVSIYENDSVLFDEFLAHRLGMLPIKADKSFKKGSSVKMVLEKEGPCTVYSKDIKSTDPKIDILDKGIPITKLVKDQRIKLEMEATLDSGKVHAKWQPAIVGYREIPAMSISKDCDTCNDCIKACPENILEAKGKKIILISPEECTLCNACADECSKGAIRFDYDHSTFLFSVEPIAGLGAKEIISSAVNELSAKTKEFAKAISKAK